MKTKQISLMLLAVLLIHAACEKKNKDLPTATVQGVWLGNWHTSDGSMQGSFLTPAKQSTDKFEGEVFIRFSAPSGEAYSPDYFGRVNSDEVRVSMDISGIEIKAEGLVNNHKDVEGRFYVGQTIQGSFSGAKYPLIYPKTEEVFVTRHTEDWYGNLFSVNNNFWLINSSQGEIDIFDESGKKLETREDSFIRMEPVSFSGDHFYVYNGWSENYGERILKYSNMGILKDSFKLIKSRPDALYWKDHMFYFLYNDNREIYASTGDNEFSDSTTIDFLSAKSFLPYKSGFLITSHYSSYLFYIDKNGSLVHGYQIDDVITSMASNKNGEIYCLTQKNISEEGPGIYKYKVLRIEIEP